MLGLRLSSEVQKRWKNDMPHQRTTGVARMNSSHGMRGPSKIRMNSCGQIMLPMAMASSGAVSMTLIKKRRVMSRSSGFSSAEAVTVRGSRAMPQIGQEPGSERTILGCIGQVYSVRVAETGISGSSAMPQEGHAPGFDSRTSGHMGQM